MQDDRERAEPPVNPLPPVVFALFAVIMGIEAAMSLGQAGWAGGPNGVGWRIAAIEDYGFSPAVWAQVTESGNFAFDILKRFVTYPFVHGSFTHAIFAAVLLLALGKFVGEVFSSVAVLVVFVLASVVGAAVYGAIVTPNIPLYGSYPAVYGLIGAYTYILWMKLGQSGRNQYMAFRLIGFLMVMQLVFGLLFGSQPTWIADVAGFVVGLAVSVLVAPGGWNAFVARLRVR